MIRQQWLLIVVIAAGLIGMHHLVHVHTGHIGHMQPMAMARATPTEHLHPTSIGATPVAVTSPLVSHADCCDPMAMAGHFCLAVLAAITTLVAVLIFAAMWRRPLKPTYLLATINAVAARAPPIRSPGLTRLCVLRC